MAHLRACPNAGCALRGPCRDTQSRPRLHRMLAGDAESTCCERLARGGSHDAPDGCCRLPVAVQPALANTGQPLASAPCRSSRSRPRVGALGSAARRRSGTVPTWDCGAHSEGVPLTLAPVRAARTHASRSLLESRRSPGARKTARRMRHAALAHRGTLQFPGAHRHANLRARCADPRVLGTRESDRRSVGEASAARRALGRRRRARGRSDHALRMHEGAIRRHTVESGLSGDGGFRTLSLGVRTSAIVVTRIRGCGGCGDRAARKFGMSRQHADGVRSTQAHASRTVHQRRAGRGRTRRTTERDHGHQQEHGPKGTHGTIQTHPRGQHQGISSPGTRVSSSTVSTAFH